MANLKFTSEILDDIQFRAGEPTTSDSDFYDQALKQLNRAYRIIWMGGGELVPEMNEPWLWLKKDPPGTVILQPVYTTGTVSVTNNDTSVTFSGVINTDLDGWFLKINDHPDVFRIASHTSGSASATLDSVYTGPTDTAESFTLMKLEYELASDFLRVIAPMRVQAEGRSEIDGIDLSSLDFNYPLTYVAAGVPEAFSLVTESKVRFSHAGGTDSTQLIRVEYDYLRRPDDLTDSGSEEPAIPLHYRHILSDVGLYLLFEDKGDLRAEAVGLQARAGLKAMAADNRARLQQMSRTFGKIITRPGRTSRFQRVLRTASGLIVG